MGKDKEVREILGRAFTKVKENISDNIAEQLMGKYYVSSEYKLYEKLENYFVPEKKYILFKRLRMSLYRKRRYQFELKWGESFRDLYYLRTGETEHFKDFEGLKFIVDDGVYTTTYDSLTRTTYPSLNSEDNGGSE